MLNILVHLTKAYHNSEGSSVISHQTARYILNGKNRDYDFMGVLNWKWNIYS
jgi:hypothetical protein